MLLWAGLTGTGSLTCGRPNHPPESPFLSWKGDESKFWGASFAALKDRLPSAPAPSASLRINSGGTPLWTPTILASIHTLIYKNTCYEGQLRPWI